MHAVCKSSFKITIWQKRTVLGLFSQHLRMWTMGCEGEEVISHVAVNIWVTESKDGGLPPPTNIIALRSD